MNINNKVIRNKKALILVILLCIFITLPVIHLYLEKKLSSKRPLTPNENPIPIIQSSFDVKTYGFELSEKQYTTFLSHINKKEVDISARYIYPFKDNRPDVWSYWPIDSDVQNHFFLIKGNVICGIKNISWCGSVNVEKECKEFDINRKDWINSMGGRCCRAYKTKKPYILSCIDGSRLNTPDIELNKQLTEETLKEGNINCGVEQACLSPIESVIPVFTPDYYR